MEYAAGGELFERICNAGRFSEDEVFYDTLGGFGCSMRIQSFRYNMNLFLK